MMSKEAAQAVLDQARFKVRLARECFRDELGFHGAKHLIRLHQICLQAEADEELAYMQFQRSGD